MTPELLQLEMCVVIMMMLQCHNLGTTINNGTSNVTNTNAPQFDNYLPFLLFQIPSQRFEHHIHASKVASYTRGPELESSHRHILMNNY